MIETKINEYLNEEEQLDENTLQIVQLVMNQIMLEFGSRDVKQLPKYIEQYMSNIENKVIAGAVKNYKSRRAGAR